MTTTEKVLVPVCLLTIPGVILLTTPGVIFPGRPSVPISSEVSTPFPSPNLLFAMRTVESSLRPDAVSQRGARGLYQIMPETWQDHSEHPFSRAFEPHLNEIVTKLISLAKAGDFRAIESIADRLDGKPTQRSEITGADGGPVINVIHNDYEPEETNGDGDRDAIVSRLNE